MATRFTVALIVIARDEAPRIGRLLHSVAPWVDEMWLLDTGSADATAAMAAACGARVAHAVWGDDFAAARNTALALSTADWHLVLDADEWLISGGEVLQALRHTPPDFVGRLQLQDQFADGAQQHVASAWLSRVLPGTVRYAGRIHEQPQHALPLRNLPVLIGHDGYQPAALAAKRGRNRRLLQQALLDAPTDPYLFYQLGKDCAVYDEHAEAEVAFARAAELLTDAATSWWPDLVSRRLFALKRLQQHGAAIDFAHSQLGGVCAESPDFFFALGDVLLDLAAEQSAQGEVLLPMIEQAWRQCLELGERPDQTGAVAGRGSYLAAHNLALVLEGTGRADEARTLRAAFVTPR